MANITGEGEEGRPSDAVFLCALPPEALAVRAGLRLGRGQWSAVRLVGMGPHRARKASARLASSLPDGVPVVVLGVGGSLVTGFSPGDVVVANSFGLADAAPGADLCVTSEPRPLDQRSMAFADRLAAELRGAFPSTQLAPVLSANRTARGGERAVLSESGAVICDTESFWLARLAERRPFAVVRSIVDTPDRELMSVSTVTGGMLGLKRLADIARLIAGSGS